MNDREERIRARAYALWEQAGRPEGQEADHWAEAERQVDAEQGMGEGSDTTTDESEPAEQDAEPGERKVAVRRKKKDSVKPTKVSSR